jgi:SAM-dependent methyltransferase
MLQKFHCRLCRSTLDNAPCFRLNNLPIGVQYFPDEVSIIDDKPVSINIYRCSSCGFLQALGTQIVYEGENSAATSISPAMIKHKVEQAENFLDKYDLKGKKIIEAGCGDGHFLKMLREAGAGLVVGVEPSVRSKDSSIYKNDVVIHSEYISERNVLKEGPFDAFATFHVLEHIPDIHDFISGISVNLKEGGIGFVEVPSSELIEDELRFYDIINDHLNYFTLRTLRLAFEMHDFDVLEAYRDWNKEHNVIVVKKRQKYDYGLLETAKQQTVRNLLDILNKFSDQGVAIWGASMHSLTLLSQLKTNKVKYVIDSAPYKQNRFTPISHFPIVSPDNLVTNPVELVVVIAPRFVDEIVEDLKNKISFNGTVAILNNEQIVLID